MTSLLIQYHPNIALRCKEIHHAGNGREFNNWFGAWHIMTVNFAKVGKSVKTRPHVDWKNPAIMFCAVVAFGESS